MNVCCTVMELKGILDQLKYSVAPQTGSIPILTHVLLEARDGHVNVCATDLDTTMTCRFSAHVEEEGPVVVPYSWLSTFVTTLARKQSKGQGRTRANRRSPSTCGCDWVTLSSGTDGEIVLRSGESHSTAKGEDPSQFPHMPPLEEVTWGHEVVVVMKTALLCAMVERVAYGEGTRQKKVVSKKEGVVLKIDGKQLMLSGWTGTTLGTCTASLDTAVQIPVEIGVPPHNLIRLARQLRAIGMETVQLSILLDKYPRAWFSTPTCELSTWIFEDPYADVPLPSSEPHHEISSRVTVDVSEFTRALSFVASIERHGVVRVELRTGGQGKLLISAQVEGNGMQGTDIPCTHEGMPVRKSVFPGVLMGLLKALKTPSVTLEWCTDTSSPLYLLPAEDGTGFHTSYMDTSMSNVTTEGSSAQHYNE